MSEQTTAPQNEPRPEDEESEQPAQSEMEARSVSKALQHLPEVREFMAMSMGPMANPLHQKMTPDHISSVIDLAHKHDEREFQLSVGQQRIESSDRWFYLIIMIVAVVTILIIIGWFRNDREILIPVLTAIVSFLGGLGSGVGLRKSKRE